MVFQIPNPQKIMLEFWSLGEAVDNDKDDDLLLV